MYYRARWYDPNLGRFISEDPIGFGGGDINLYGYVGNDAPNFTDPLGRDCSKGKCPPSPFKPLTGPGGSGNFGYGFNPDRIPYHW